MGIGGFSPTSLLLILLIIMVLFGTKRLRSLGEDIGSAVRGFRKGVKEAEAADEKTEVEQLSQEDTKTKSETKS